MRPNIIAIVPARGGSKGVPRKNVRLLCGKPLIAYTIEAALSSKLVDKVVVSTKDEEIAEVSKKYGAEVLERPEELARDDSPTIDAVMHVLNWFEERKDVVAILKPKRGNENQYLKMSDKGKKIFDNIKQRCFKSGRFYFVDNPGEFFITEVIAISDINITMGMGSPSTIALLCGKIGLYYDTTGDDYHPFTQKYRNKVVFDNNRDLFSAVGKIIDEGYNPLDEIEPDLLEDYDRFRDERGLERFREALLENL